MTETEIRKRLAELAAMLKILTRKPAKETRH
jgi:hypothetical protein